jgi:hypothetical protein
MAKRWKSGAPGNADVPTWEWLDSRHTLSFGQHHDKDHVGFHFASNLVTTPENEKMRNSVSEPEAH